MTNILNAELESVHLAVIGLGYVGLPLAVEFGKKFPTIGFDINPLRIAALQLGNDSTLEVSAGEIEESTHLSFESKVAEIKNCNTFIVTVPTPIDSHKQPDLKPLLLASKMIGAVLKRGDFVIYESTVYPGATEEDCVPVLETESGLKLNTDFFVGYSPERINPGDKKHRLTSIMKITSGSTPEAAHFVDKLYSSIISAGTHKAESIRVAEAAKVIENTQRDLNIALINELAVIFNRMGLDTGAVLKAAGTKWNFLPFKPGLVGGHCIGVDPYYLTHKAQAIGYHPEIILAGRRLNDGMASYVAGQMIKLMLSRELRVKGGRVLVLGITFKENCPDIRNTKVVDVVTELKSFGVEVDVFDPWADADECHHEYGLVPISEPTFGSYDGILVAVAHREFAEYNVEQFRRLGRPGAVIYDLKHILPPGLADKRL